MTKTIASAALFAALSLVNHGAIAGDPAKGEQLAATCVACHGPGGNKPIADYPIIAGQHASYLARALADYKSGVRANPIMAGIAAPLSKQDQADLAAYFSRQTSSLSTLDRK